MVGATFRLAPLPIVRILRISLPSLCIPGTSVASQCHFPLNPIAGSPAFAIKRRAPTRGRNARRRSNRRAWNRFRRTARDDARAGSPCSQPLRRDSRRHADAMSRRRSERKITARPRGPRAAPAAERCSNAVLECRVYKRFAVTSQSKLPRSERRGLETEQQDFRPRALPPIFMEISQFDAIQSSLLLALFDQPKLFQIKWRIGPL